MKICVQCTIKGKVQGVWYRQSTWRMADAFGVTGWVRNLVNGDVEVLACGEAEDVEKLQKWLWQGPLHAEVKEVTCQPVDCDAPPSFEVQR